MFLKNLINDAIARKKIKKPKKTSRKTKTQAHELGLDDPTYQGLKKPRCMGFYA